jgi:hypothetical protein
MKSPLLSVELIRDKYTLYIINKIVSMVGLSRDLLYTYKSKKIITSNMNYSSRWRSTMIYHAYNNFNPRDHLGFDT